MAIAASSLDVNSIVSQLMELEKQPLKVLDTKEASFQAKISAYGTVKSALASLQSAVQTLTQANTFKALGITSTDINVVSGSATTEAAPGTYNIVVDELASAHTVRSNGAYTATSATFNTGTLSIKVGNGAAVDVEITTNNNSLAQVRNAINNAGAGVNATIINDGTNQRLVLTSKTMGLAGEITVTATDSGSGGTNPLSDLDSGNLQLVQLAKDAAFTVNGLSITRPSNTISDVVQGLTLTLAKEGNSTITVAKNPSAAVNAVTAFVTAYNAVVAQNSSLSAYDAANEDASILTGDATLRSIQSKLGSLVNARVSGVTGGLSSLSQVGVSLQRDGTLKLDTSKLTAALNDPDKDVASLFTQTTNGNKGIAIQFNDWLTQATGTSGILASRIDGLTGSIASLDGRRDAINDRLVTIEARYRKQYSALDALITSMSSTSSFLEQQLSNLPGTSKK